MDDATLLLVAIGIAVIAFLYATVGHAGASGYIAVLSLAGLVPQVIRPTALALNILVAGITTWQFARRGHFAWRLWWPFALPAVPLAFVGGMLDLPVPVFQALLGVVLLGSAAWFLVRPPAETEGTPPPLAIALPVGAGLGLLAGLTGTGGGIFLTPLVLLMRWAPARTAAAVSAVFILLNSTAGLLGIIRTAGAVPPQIGLLAVVAAVAGWAGAACGSGRFSPLLIKRLLAVVLLIAGAKMLLAAVA